MMKLAYTLLLAIVLVVCLGHSSALAAESFGDEPMPRMSYAQTPVEAATELFPGDEEVTAEPGTAGYTQFLSIDNRVRQGLPTPNHKYRVAVEVITVTGERFFTTFDDWKDVPAGGWSNGEFYQLNRRVRKCRYYWKDRKYFGRWQKSDWVVADPGHFIVYAQIEWFGTNERVLPIYNYQDPTVVMPNSASDE